MICMFAYLSTLPHKSGISRFLDHFPISRSYFKNKPTLTLFGPSPDFYFHRLIKKIEAIFIICFFACLQFFKVKVGLTSDWTRQFPISSGSFRQWYVVNTIGSPTKEGLQIECSGNSVTSRVQENKNRISLLVLGFVWLVIEIRNPEIVYFSTTKHLKRQKNPENSNLLSTFASDRVYLVAEK